MAGNCSANFRFAVPRLKVGDWPKQCKVAWEVAIDDQELLRYSRQIMLPEIDVAGQERLRGAAALLLGLGGLGSPIALYLAAAGIGRLVVVDGDVVDLSNLQRQIAHGDGDIGKAKVRSAVDAVAAINPACVVQAVEQRVAEADLSRLVGDVDLALDAADNFAVRFALNAACWRAGVPLVSGAAVRWEGQVAVFDPGSPESPCYRCLYAQDGGEVWNCAENGVVAPLVGVVGSLQAMEAVKLITKVGEPLVGKVLYYDAKRADWRSFRLTKRSGCPVCAG